MPRLDNVRVEVWRDFQSVSSLVERTIDEALRDEWDITLGWFDVLTALQRAGGTARPLDIASDLRLPASSISRRLDRLEEEGWIARHRHVDEADKRAVDIELTRTGRRLWREMNVSYRRAVQAAFAAHLDDDDIATVRRILDELTPVVDPAAPDPNTFAPDTAPD